MLTIIPCCGTGERMRAAGYETWKPLLPVHGTLLLNRVVESYLRMGKVLLICPEHYRHAVMHAIDRHRRDGHFYVDFLSTPTAGPVETICQSLIALWTLCTSEDVCVADADSWLERGELHTLLAIFRDLRQQLNSQGRCLVAGVPFRYSHDAAMSYLRHTQGWVQEVREHDPFTETSATGPYWWATGWQCINYLTRAAQQHQYRIAPLLQAVLEDGGKVATLETHTFVHLGTPEEYEAYLTQPQEAT